MQQKIHNILEFLTEIEKLKSVLRHSQTSSGRQESVPEHCWRMATMAIILEKELPDVDIKKVLEMTLVHDFGEIYDGDTPAFLENPNKLEKEETAIKKLVKPLSKDVQTKIINLWKEYNECKTKESKVAKALDRLEALIQHNEADISSWLPHEYNFNLTYGKEFMDFNDLIKELRKAVDKQTKEKISKI